MLQCNLCSCAVEKCYSCDHHFLEKDKVVCFSNYYENAHFCSEKCRDEYLSEFLKPKIGIVVKNGL